MRSFNVPNVRAAAIRLVAAGEPVHRVRRLRRRPGQRPGQQHRLQDRLGPRHHRPRRGAAGLLAASARNGASDPVRDRPRQPLAALAARPTVEGRPARRWPRLPASGRPTDSSSAGRPPREAGRATSWAAAGSRQSLAALAARPTSLAAALLDQLTGVARCSTHCLTRSDPGLRRSRRFASVVGMVGRIPVMDVMPLVDLGRQPAKATAGEPFPVTATVFREGHDKLGAEVVLTGPDGVRRPPVRMLPAGGDEPDRYLAWVTPDAEGAWTFEVQAWSDPIATWQHAAGLKIPAEVDVELMFTEGRLLLERVLAGSRQGRPPHCRRRPGRDRGQRPTPTVRRPPGSPRSSPPTWSRCWPPTRCASTSPSRARSRRTRTASGRSSAAGTSSSHDPRARPATRRPAKVTSGTFAPRRSGSTPSPTMGFDVIYLPADPPDRRGEPQGPEQHAHPGSGRHRITVGDRQQGRRARRGAPRPRHARRLRRVRGAGSLARASRSPSTWRCSAPPTTRG